MTIAGWFRRLLAREQRAPRAAPPMITCAEALAALHAYLDGELTGEDHDRVKAHLDVCARCYPQLRVESSFRLAVRRATRGERAPDALRRRLEAVLRDTTGGD